MSNKGPSYARVFAFIRLAFFIRKRRPQFVIAHGIYPLVAASLFGLIFPQTKVIYRNMSLHNGSSGQPLKIKLHRFVIKKADSLIFPSDKQKIEVLSGYGLQHLGAKIIPRGVDYSAVLTNEARESVLKEVALDSDVRLIVHVAAFEPVKNHLGLVSIARKLLIQDNKIRFVLIGDGCLRNEIEQQLPENMVSLGYRDDAEKFIAAADVAVLVSHAEGFGAVLAEASAYGVPSVAYDVGGVGTIVKTGINGALVPYKDEDAFCAALLSILNMSDNQRGLMRRKAQTIFGNEFSMKVCNDRYLCYMREFI
jgi:glycosyltransferase involved in cell wall biosynthesis